MVILEQADKKYALKWTAFDPKNDTFEAFYKLNSAKNWEDFKSALSRYGGATQNFVYADVKGNIGFHNAGAIPVRNSGRSDMPFDGAKNEGKWISQIPFAELPESYNPPEGFIVTANQRLAGDSYKYFLGNVWADPYRARRIYDLLKANNKQTVNDSEDIQRDIYNISSANFAREIIKTEGASAETLNLLKGWDGKMSADSQAALIVSEIRSAFLRKILEAKIGADLAKDYRSSTMNSTIDWLAREQPADWLPKEFSSYKDLFMASELTAIENLTRKYGADKSNWIWGNERKINFVHPLSNAPLIGGIFKIRFGQRFRKRFDTECRFDRFRCVTSPFRAIGTKRATAFPSVRAAIRNHLFIKTRFKVGARAERPNFRFQIKRLKRQQKKLF